MNFQINERFVPEYLALIEVGATHAEAVAQIALTNEVAETEVEAATEALA
ncbi:hypothetical protein WG922_07740 [Ramlibacter sp. AN1015]